jgi:hypothetical protein
MRAVALIVFGGMWAGCSYAQCDPDAKLARLAGAGAIACGTIDVGWTPLALLDAHDCAVGAAAARRPFWLSISGGVADGAQILGFASDGARVIELDYTAVYSMGIGGDDEDARFFACDALGDRGARCDSMAGDLCLVCGGATPVSLECP